MAGEAIRVEGLRETNRFLNRVDRELADRLKAAGKEGAEEVATLARQIVPYRSGNLARTIRAGATRRSATVKAGGRRAVYGPPIHFGWVRHHIRPQPFMYEALDRRRDEVIDVYTKAIARLIDDADQGA